MLVSGLTSLADATISELPLWALAVLAVLGTSTTTVIITHWFERRNRVLESDLTDAQATDVIVNAGKTAVELMKAELDRALQRIERLEAENRQLRREVRDLRQHIERLESES